VTEADLVVEVQNACAADGVPSPERIVTWARGALDGTARGELTVRIVDQLESAALNKRYRRQEGPTNVLAFPAEQGIPLAEGEPAPLGDLVICAEVLAREAAEQGKTLEAHWAHVVIHGVLHLLGHDHRSPAEAHAMESRERALLAGFGFPDPYRGA
jgi:probable rRNA maturation factor